MKPQIGSLDDFSILSNKKDILLDANTSTYLTLGIGAFAAGQVDDCFVN
jgi:hypothetical protein